MSSSHIARSAPQHNQILCVGHLDPSNETSWCGRITKFVRGEACCVVDGGVQFVLDDGEVVYPAFVLAGVSVHHDQSCEAISKRLSCIEIDRACRPLLMRH